MVRFQTWASIARKLWQVTEASTGGSSWKRELRPNYWLAVSSVGTKVELNLGHSVSESGLGILQVVCSRPSARIMLVARILSGNWLSITYQWVPCSAIIVCHTLYGTTSITLTYSPSSNSHGIAILMETRLGPALSTWQPCILVILLQFGKDISGISAQNLAKLY